MAMHPHDYEARIASDHDRLQSLPLLSDKQDLRLSSRERAQKGRSW